MELFAGDDNISYEKMLGHYYGKYEHFGQKHELEKKSIEELCGSNITLDDALISIVENLAALHYYHWNDKSLFTKYPYIRFTEWMQGQNKEDFDAKV